MCRTGVRWISMASRSTIFVLVGSGGFIVRPILRKRLSSMTVDFDVVHLHSVFLFPTWAGARSAVRARVPYVLSPRGMLVRELIAQRSTVTKRAWISSSSAAILRGRPAFI